MHSSIMKGEYSELRCMIISWKHEKIVTSSSEKQIRMIMAKLHDEVKNDFQT